MKLELRRGGVRWVLAAIGVFLLGTLVLLVAVSIGGTAPETDDGARATTSPASSPTPEPTASTAPALAVGQAGMPLTGDCLACHETKEGVGTKPIPALAHPVEGWRDCTACHSANRLVKTAPGHSGIHAQECLNCHKVATAAGPERPHSSLRIAGCLECHGSRAPLPATMVGRPDTACWICHHASSIQAPKLPHALPADGICQSCHSAGQLGALPASHAGRSDAICTSCHAVSPEQAPIAPHDLASRAGLCSFCHGPEAARQ